MPPAGGRKVSIYDMVGRGSQRGILSDLVARNRRLSEQSRRIENNTVVNNYTNNSSASGFTFISPTTVATGTSDTGGWVTFSLTGIVPSSASLVILETAYEISDPDSGADLVASIKYRVASGQPEYEVARGRSSGNADNNADVSQGIYPINRSPIGFDYSVEAPGFNLGWSINIIGYIS